MAGSTPDDVPFGLEATSPVQRMGRLNSVEIVRQLVIFVSATPGALELRRNRPMPVGQRAPCRSTGGNGLLSCHHPRCTLKTVC